MEKCEKITRKMESMVENLTTGKRTQMELTEQPDILNPAMKLTEYQMIGYKFFLKKNIINWHIHYLYVQVSIVCKPIF